MVCHQDSTYLYTTPPSVVGLWLALEDAIQTNGCLFVLPGSHAKAVSRRFIGKDGAVHYDGPAKDYAMDAFVPVEVRSGALVILHGQVVHCSKENTSPLSRHAYSVHFVEGSPDVEWASDNW